MMPETGNNSNLREASGKGLGGACLLPVRIGSISSSKTLRHVARGRKKMLGTTMAIPH
jgi:hypothetical protein